jgi:Ran GTPase-activating protein (RanGAP) involved in mRNA processing and transport
LPSRRVPDTDEWLPGLASLEGLTHLNLNASGASYLTKSGLRHLKTYKKLQHLTLLGRSVTDDWLEQLVEVIASNDLYELDLRETSIEGPGFVHLKKLPNLDWLDMSHSRLKDDGMKTLVASVPKLRWLFLDGNNITDAGLEALANCKTLEVLTLKDNKKVTDKGMEFVATCPKLRELDLANTDIGDAGARALVRASALKKLILTGTGVSAKGIQELKEGLPGCEIIQGEKK